MKGQVGLEMTHRSFFFVAVLRCSTTTIIIRVLLCDFGFTAGLKLIFSGSDLDEAVLWTGY